MSRLLGGVPRAARHTRPTNFSVTGILREEPPPMIAFPELAKRHQSAGERYAAACAELRSAMIELAALDGLMPPSAGNTFAAWQPNALAELRHRGFAPHPPQNIRSAVAVRVEEIRKEITHG